MPPGVLRLMRIAPVQRGAVEMPNQCAASNKALVDLGIAPLRSYASKGATITLRCRACGAITTIEVGAEWMPAHARPE
jgi:hypothetical protein